jgi:hypothetical protein
MAGEATNGTPAGAVERQLTSFVAKQLWAGQAASEVIARLIARGLEAGTASTLVNAVAEEMRRRGVL